MEIDQLVDEKYLRGVLDAFPIPVLIVDKGLTIHDANHASKKLLGDDISAKLRELCGDTLGCIHAISRPGGCGTTDFCPECVLRQTSAAVAKGESSFRRLSKMKIQSDGRVQEKTFLVSGAPLQHAGRSYVILTLEDITELTELRKIVPICSFCRKVRDDDDYWQEVEHYFAKYSTIRFSHGVCPDCRKQHYSEFLKDQ
ncbi:PAS domain-containing protein [Desulfosarcina sp.]|uniref:PAS domain-containing protein n=1 Tax=Desulfosarcina sp. TaxID=2027861 RepID=UPI003565A362